MFITLWIVCSLAALYWFLKLHKLYCGVNNTCGDVLFYLFLSVLGPMSLGSAFLVYIVEKLSYKKMESNTCKKIINFINKYI